MPPVIQSTFLNTHTFRYAFSNVAEKYVFTAADLLRIILAGNTSATSLTALAVCFRLRAVDAYFSNSTANLGRLDLSASLRFASGSGALDQDTKVVDEVENAYSGALPSHMRIVPPAQSTVGFWHNETAVGDVFTLSTGGGGLSGILDITLDLVLGSNTEAGTVVCSSSSAFAGIKQRNIFGTVAATFLAPVGLPNYTN